MHDAPWHEEVGRLLDQAAQALRDKADRRAVRAFGTAIAYLELARESGDRLAAELLAQMTETAKEGPTERFTFAPGELEALASHPSNERPSSEPPARPTARPSRKKKK
jgi:hypothetical protein